MDIVVRMKTFFINLLVMLTVVILIGCSTQSPTTQISTVATELSVKVVPTITPSVISTIIPSLTPETIITEYPLKQLSQEEKKRKVAELLRTNDKCTLPCFMGVELNKSSLEDIQKSFSRYMGEGLITRDQVTGNVTYGSGFETSNLIRSSFKIHLSQNKTDGIDLYLGGMWRPEVKRDDWMPYTLSGILKQLGNPSQVRFYVTMPPNEKSTPGIIINTVLYYESLNIVVIYFGQRIDESPELQFCPMQQQPEYMVMHIGTYAKEDNIVGIRLEDSSSLSINDFYNMDWDDPSVCVLLNSDVLKSSK